MTTESSMVVGRYAPSPTGDLHVGNLRTALLAWLSAHHQGGILRLRIDDLDPRTSSMGDEQRQRTDLRQLGVTFDPGEIRQSERSDHYDAAIANLVDRGMVYPCYCSRREIREAASAPHQHLPDGAYPGTCAGLGEQERRARELDRPAALRVRASNIEIEVHDRRYGSRTELVDDFVIRRNDGVPSYNLATVIDDHAQGVTEVVRGADLLAGTARHIWLRDVLGLPQVQHGHVPLVVNSNGERLAKRDGAVTLEDLAAQGFSADAVRGRIAETLDLASRGEQPTMLELLERYDPDAIPTAESVWDVR